MMNPTSTQEVQLNSRNKIVYTLLAVVLILALILLAIIINNRNTAAKSLNAEPKDYISKLPDNTCPTRLVTGISSYAEYQGQKYSYIETQQDWIERNCPDTVIVVPQSN